MQSSHAASTAPAGQGPSLLSAARLVRIQAASGLIFAVFGGLHLLNTVLAAFGPATYNAFQRALRPIYQDPRVEVGLVLVPLAVHAAASIARMRGRRAKTHARPSLKVRAHRYAGWFLLAAMAGHVTATRGPALLRGAYPEFEGVAFTFQFMPFFFYPYYALLALAGALHALIGLGVALPRLGVRVPALLQRGRGAQLALAAACAAVLVGVAGLGGMLFPLDDLARHPFALAVRDTYAALLDAAAGRD
jgi:succinate dehydrogenase/fumarate reductase cytochrome b subunit